MLLPNHNPFGLWQRNPLLPDFLNKGGKKEMFLEERDDPLWHEDDNEYNNYPKCPQMVVKQMAPAKGRDCLQDKGT